MRRDPFGNSRKKINIYLIPIPRYYVWYVNSGLEPVHILEAMRVHILYSASACDFDSCSVMSEER
jgi:hypothetical protein